MGVTAVSSYPFIQCTLYRSTLCEQPLQTQLSLSWNSTLLLLLLLLTRLFPACFLSGLALFLSCLAFSSLTLFLSLLPLRSCRCSCASFPPFPSFHPLSPHSSLYSVLCSSLSSASVYSSPQSPVSVHRTSCPKRSSSSLRPPTVTRFLLLPFLLLISDIFLHASFILSHLFFFSPSLLFFFLFFFFFFFSFPGRPRFHHSLNLYPHTFSLSLYLSLFSIFRAEPWTGSILSLPFLPPFLRLVFPRSLSSLSTTHTYPLFLSLALQHKPRRFRLEFDPGLERRLASSASRRWWFFLTSFLFSGFTIAGIGG